MCKRTGLSTYPWGTPVLIKRVEDVCPLILTHCVRLVKKSTVMLLFAHIKKKSAVLSV